MSAKSNIRYVCVIYVLTPLCIIYDSFKDHSPWCAQAGLLLAIGGQYSPVVKHFGLKLMEHMVQSRWPHITQAEKIFIKVFIHKADSMETLS